MKSARCRKPRIYCGVLCRLTSDLQRLRADSKTSESRLQQELQRAENRARLAHADAERQKAALDKERRYSSTKDQVMHPWHALRLGSTHAGLALRRSRQGLASGLRELLQLAALSFVAVQGARQSSWLS